MTTVQFCSRFSGERIPACPDRVLLVAAGHAVPFAPPAGLRQQRA